jgi:hypothetical protein
VCDIEPKRRETIYYDERALILIFAFVLIYYVKKTMYKRLVLCDHYHLKAGIVLFLN